MGAMTGVPRGVSNLHLLLIREGSCFEFRASEFIGKKLYEEVTMPRRRFYLGLELFSILAAAMVMLWLSATSSAQTSGTLRYVAPTGNDAGNNCTVPANPCKTIQYAIDLAAISDQIWVAGGGYTGEGEGPVITVAKSITLYGGWNGAPSGPPLRDPNANPTTVDGENTRLGIFISGGAPWLEGFIITRGKGDVYGGGIRVENASPTIRMNQVIGNSAVAAGGIMVNRGAAQIIENLIMNNIANWGGGLELINDANATIVQNEIRGNVATGGGGGIDVQCCGQGNPLIARNLIVENNGGSRGGAVNIMDTSVQLVNNILARNQATRGAGLYVEGQVSHPASATLTNNTLVGHPSGGVALWNDTYAAATLVNNILTAHHAGITNNAPASSTISADHNLFWNINDSIIGSNAVIANPLLDATYHLTSASPARDAGAVVSLTVDFDGTPRPMGGAYDIGADEFALRMYLPLVLGN